MQIRYVNKALQRFDSTQVIPIQFVLFTLCVILGSAVLYRDFEKTTARQAAAFVGGCLLTFFGVFLITSGRQHKEVDDEDLLSDVDGIEETIGLTRHEDAVSAPPTAQDPETPKSQSRRSSRISRVSFADTVKPGSPLGRSDMPNVAKVASNSEPSLIAIEPETPIVSDNRWRESWSSIASSPCGGKTLPTEFAAAGSAVASTPSNSAATTPNVDHGGIPTYPTDRPVTPRQSSGASRPVGHRRSKTFISPSPLSSTVTTVVKDAFLREADPSLVTASSLRKIRSSIRASLFFTDDGDTNTRLLGYTPIAASDMDAVAPQEAQGGVQHSEADEASRRRSRSVSDAIGDFFRPKKKSKNETPSSDVEAGGSQNSV